MRSKLQHNLSQLTKIHNQMRLQLNKIRYTRELQYPDTSPRVSKRVFYDKIKPTNPFLKEEHSQALRNIGGKRFYDKNNIANSNFNRTFQRRHFYQQSQDKVDLSVSLPKSSCSYTRSKTFQAPNGSKSPVRPITNTSLPGLGMQEKTISLGGIRIIHSYHTFNAGLV